MRIVVIFVEAPLGTGRVFDLRGQVLGVGLADPSGSGGGSKRTAQKGTTFEPLGGAQRPKLGTLLIIYLEAKSKAKVVYSSKHMCCTLYPAKRHETTTPTKSSIFALQSLEPLRAWTSSAITCSKPHNLMPCTKIPSRFSQLDIYVSS